MKVPISWLKEYVDLDASAEAIAEKLTFSGIEVESIETIGGGLEGVVAGEVTAIEKHPGADRLRLCSVSDGGETYRVVCGADNFAVGDKAAFAPVGTTLPGGFKIKKARIRGEASYGMLCAEDELGLSDDHAGILLLPPDTAAGTPLHDVIGPPETVLDLEITWNRPDCLSIIGIARELAALYGLELKRPAVDYPEQGPAVSSLVSVDIQDAAGCPRYTARVLRDIVPGPSPDWMQRRLTACGVRPINNVVDITNYVMLECGHPLHAFDYDLVTDGRIVVRKARADEVLETLDHVERRLTPEMVVIADPAQPIALGGVMGGAATEIRPETKQVLLESATFYPPAIRTAASRLGLASESSHRFERGVDVEGVNWAGARAAALMAALAGAKAAPGVVDAYPRPCRPPRVPLCFQRVRDLMGVAVDDDAIVAILTSLELTVAERTAEACTVAVPSFRPDIEVEADLIEEVARMYGLDRVPDVAPAARVVPDADDSPARAVSACRSALVGLGFAETLNYSFVSQALLDRFDAAGGARRVVLPNPVSADHAVMRDSLIPQMVDTLGRNRSRQIQDAACFEIGKTFHRDDNGHEGEQNRVCVGLMGDVAGAQGAPGSQGAAERMFLRLKGAVEALAASQHAGAVELAPCDKTCFEPGYGVSVMLNRRAAGVMGLIRDALRHEWRLADPIAVAELDLEPLLAHTFAERRLAPVPAYPSVTRDVALLVAETVRHADLVAVMRRAAPEELTDITLFDIFRGDGLGDARKSMAYSLTYRALDRTLTDEEANAFHERIKDALRSELEVEIR